MKKNSSLKLCLQAIEDKLGDNPVVLDMRKHNPFVDYYIICGARNEANAEAILHEAEEKCVKAEEEIHLLDRQKGSGWFLLEVGNVLLHIFYDGKREYYGLEELWKDLRISVK